MTPAINLSPVSTTLAINPCHIFSVIAGAIDTGDKYIGSVIDTGEQLSLGTTANLFYSVEIPTPEESMLCSVKNIFIQWR
jgi:hypothetical protein